MSAAEPAAIISAKSKCQARSNLLPGYPIHGQQWLPREGHQVQSQGRGHPSGYQRLARTSSGPPDPSTKRHSATRLLITGSTRGSEGWNRDHGPRWAGSADGQHPQPRLM